MFNVHHALCSMFTMPYVQCSPYLMFNRVIVKHWSQLEHVIGHDKIYANFLVNATTTASSVTEQALDCITQLINHDFDNNPWNKSQEHIAPKEKHVC